MTDSTAATPKKPLTTSSDFDPVGHTDTNLSSSLLMDDFIYVSPAPTLKPSTPEQQPVASSVEASKRLTNDDILGLINNYRREIDDLNNKLKQEIKDATSQAPSPAAIVNPSPIYNQPIVATAPMMEAQRSRIQDEDSDVEDDLPENVDGFGLDPASLNKDPRPIDVVGNKLSNVNIQQQHQYQPPQQPASSASSCPLCFQVVPSSALQAHVNECLDKPSSRAPASAPAPSPSRQNNNLYPILPAQPAQPAPRPAPAPAPAPAPSRPLSEAEVMLDEQRAYLIALERRKKQEEEDRLLAQRLLEVERHVPVVVPAPAPQPPAKSSAQLAYELQQREVEEYKRRQAEREEADRRMAEQLMRDEQQAANRLAEEERQRRLREEQERDRRRREIDAVSQADHALALALKEKEDLQAQLEESRRRAEQLAREQSRIRYLAPDIEAPPEWQHQIEENQLFDLVNGSAEWQRVARRFLTNLPRAEITRIQRNQNRPLWTFYALMRNRVALKNDGNANETWLFHGSRTEAYDTILKEGFDHRVANLSGVLGAGVYFAKASNTSSNYLPNNNNNRFRFNAYAVPPNRMLYCRVSLGSVGNGSTGLRRPPQKPGYNPDGSLFDSVGNGSMYCVFDNHQCYPDYVIHFYNQ